MDVAVEERFAVVLRMHGIGMTMQRKRRIHLHFAIGMVAHSTRVQLESERRIRNSDDRVMPLAQDVNLKSN